MYKGEEESWEHVWERCIRGTQWGRGMWQGMEGWVLGEEAEGEEALKKLEEARRVREDRGEGLGGGGGYGERNGCEVGMGERESEKGKK